MLVAAVSVIFLYGAIGMLAATWLANPPTGPGYWRLQLLLIFAGGALGLGLRLSRLGHSLPQLGQPSLGLLAISALTLAIVGVRKGLDSERKDSLLLGIAALAACVALLADPVLGGAPGGPAVAWLYALGFVTAALALGSVATAMILAHWYLIKPSLPIAPLQRVLFLFVGTEIAKLALLIGVVAVHWSEWSGADGGFLRAFVLGDALFVVVRAVLGVLAPLGLAWMTWMTVKIRSIQSATGILYAAIVFVLFGEIISVYLSLSTSQPF